MHQLELEKTGEAGAVLVGVANILFGSDNDRCIECCRDSNHNFTVRLLVKGYHQDVVWMVYNPTKLALELVVIGHIERHRFKEKVVVTIDLNHPRSLVRDNLRKCIKEAVEIRTTLRLSQGRLI